MKPRALIRSIAALGLLGALASAAAPPRIDFRVVDIVMLNDRFVSVKLENLSAEGVALDAQTRECILLAIDINGLRRAEYKAKYLDPALFQPHGTVELRTNFRIAAQPLRFRVTVNPNRSIPEDQLLNNTLEKVLN